MNFRNVFSLAICCLAVLTSAIRSGAATEDRPNILWLTCEDIGRDLGCYGSTFADTPNLDKLAAQGVRYAHAWSNAPVCSSARTTIITGCYPVTFGANHHRGLVPMPKSIHLFPQYLRDAGYYCSNNYKTDYNFPVEMLTCWNECGRKAHWKNRESGQPFFAVFNDEITHESRMRDEYTLTRDPALTPIPPYHPDTPESRRNWTQYHERITQMDARHGALLKELEEAGLQNDTIVFFFSDHGSGMPRHKQTPLETGLGVPFLLYIPDKYRDLAPKDYVSGGISERLISFVDLAPTVLSLAGVGIPKHMQGQAFAGKFETSASRSDSTFHGDRLRDRKIPRSV